MAYSPSSMNSIPTPAQCLDGDVLRDEGAALSPDHYHIRDRFGHWHRLAWSSHDLRYVTQSARLDATLRRAALPSD